jgi:hypothetical protein
MVVGIAMKRSLKKEIICPEGPGALTSLASEIACLSIKERGQWL